MSTPLPPASGQFSRDQHAREHLCDHLLTRPEAHDWALILPEYLALVDPMNDTALLDLARSLFSPAPCAQGVELLSAYVQGLQLAIDDALRLGWWWEQRQGKYSEWFGLGLDGVHVIWDAQILKTGFFPGSARYPPKAPPPRTENPLPRRDRLEMIRPPPPDSPRRRYELFRTGHYCVSNDYDEACRKGKVGEVGGEAFIERTPRIGKWEQWLLGRPGKCVANGVEL